MQTALTFQIKKKFIFSGVEITIENLTLKAEGFLIKSHINMSPQNFQKHRDTIPSFYIWRGFDRVIDNFGNHYLTRIEDLSSGSSHFHTYREDLTLASSTAMVHDALYITFYAQPVIIEAYSIATNGKRTRLPDIIMDNLTWRYDLPISAHRS